MGRKGCRPPAGSTSDDCAKVTGFSGVGWAGVVRADWIDTGAKARASAAAGTLVAAAPLATASVAMGGALTTGVCAAGTSLTVMVGGGVTGAPTSAALDVVRAACRVGLATAATATGGLGFG
jgi:hypothetical protein